MTASSPHCAILGSERAFPQGLRFVHPKPPPLERLKDRLVPMLESGRLTNYGPYVQAFESAIAHRLGVEHCVALANATLGLILVPWTWKLAGEVIVQSFTFSATVHAVVWAGLTPVLVDIDPQTLTISPEAVEAAISPKTKAILAVCLFGTAPDLDALEEIASRHGLRLLCDTAQGFGSAYGGRWLGSFGDAEVLSFHAAKVLPAGEGGAVTTDDGSLAHRLRLACNFGNPGSGDCEVIGMNAKMSEWSALLGLAGLETLEHDLAYRRSLWEAYRDRLGRIPGIVLPSLPSGRITNGQNCAILVDTERFGLTRDELDRVLAAEGIECKRYFDPPIHRMRAYQGVRMRVEPLPVTERVASMVLCLPLHPHLALADVETVCDLIEAARAQRSRIKQHLAGQPGSS